MQLQRLIQRTLATVLHATFIGGDCIVQVGKVGGLCSQRPSREGGCSVQLRIGRLPAVPGCILSMKPVVSLKSRFQLSSRGKAIPRTTSRGVPVLCVDVSGLSAVGIGVYHLA